MSGPLAEQDLLQRITPHARVQLNTRATPSGAACAIVARPRAILWHGRQLPVRVFTAKSGFWHELRGDARVPSARERRRTRIVLFGY